MLWSCFFCKFYTTLLCLPSKWIYSATLETRAAGFSETSLCVYKCGRTSAATKSPIERPVPREHRFFNPFYTVKFCNWAAPGERCTINQSKHYYCFSHCCLHNPNYWPICQIRQSWEHCLYEHWPLSLHYCLRHKSANPIFLATSNLT